MIIDGKQIALKIQAELKCVVGQSDMAASVHIFVVGENPVIESFVKYKKIFAETVGVDFVEHRFADNVTERELINKINQVSQGSPSLLGIVVQLPLPSHMNTQLVLDSVPSELDIDGLATESAYLAPVAGAVREIIEHEHIAVSGKEALVIGKGKLVGEPVAKLLTGMGAIVTAADKMTGRDELADLCRQSDIVVSGAGVPNLITKDMIKEDSVLLDAGTSTQENSVVGDIALDCDEVASHFACTPGGIGPITVAVLFKNLASEIDTR